MIEIVTTNVIVAVVETVIRFTPAPIANCPFYMKSVHTNIVRVVEQNLEEKICVGQSLPCGHCMKQYELTPQLLHGSKLDSIYFKVSCPHCDQNERSAK